MEHFDGIHKSPSYIYHSALPFSPFSSWLRECYSTELSLEVKVIKGLPAEWGMCSRTVFLDNTPLTLACWNSAVAVGSSSRDIIILDVVTGSQAAILSGHTDYVRSVAFSSDGASLVSGSDDKTVKLWDVQTGGVNRTFFGHTHWVYSVSITADCTMVASGSRDNMIYLWNIQTGECQNTIQQQSVIWHVCFSPMDPQHLISISGDNVWEWDTNGHQIMPPYHGSCIDFSSDGTQFVFYNGTAITIQNSGSGVVVAKFDVVNDSICCCFSPDDRLIAFSAGNNVYVWDITCPDPHLTGTFTGHAGDIISLVFSSPSSLISACNGGSVKFWKIGTASTDQIVTDTKSTSPISAPIQSITLQAKDGINITIDSDGVVKIWDILTGHCKTSFQTPAKGTSNRNAWLVGGKLIVVWHTNRKINIYDAEKREHREVDYGSHHMVRDLRVSEDGSKVFCLNRESIQAWSVQRGALTGKVEVEGDPYFKSLTVDGSKVWIYNIPLGYQGWDFGIQGSLPIQFPNIPLPWLHSNGTVLWEHHLNRVKNTVTGKVALQLSGRFLNPDDVQWNGHHLILCYLPKEVLILDFSHLLL